MGKRLVIKAVCMWAYLIIFILARVILSCESLNFGPDVHASNSLVFFPDQSQSDHVK